MRKRDRLGCWQQLLTLLGVNSLTEKEWVNLYKDYLRSWDRIYYIKLDQKALPAAEISPLTKHHVTTQSADVASAPGSQCFDMAPPSLPSVSSIKRRNSLRSAQSVHLIKRRNSLAPPAAPSAQLSLIKRRNSLASSSHSVSPIKRRNSLASRSVSPIKRRNSLAPPSSRSVSPIKRRDSLALPSTAVAKTVKRKNSEAAHDFDAIYQTDLLLSPIKRSESVIPDFEMINCDALTSPIKRRDSLALDQWMKPIEIISPLANSPILCRDSAGSDQEITLKESVSPLTSSSIKRRDSSVTSPPRVKSKNPVRKPVPKSMSVVKHVTGSGDELDDEMSLSAWKDYITHRKALSTKPLGSPKNGVSPPKLPKLTKVEPPVKRKRGRPSREEKAKRLAEEEALRMNQASMEPPIKKSTPDRATQDHNQNPSRNVKASGSQVRATQPCGAPKKLQKTTTQPTNISPSAQPTKSNKNKKPKSKQKPTAKATSQSTSSGSDQDGADTLSNVVVQPAILEEDAIPPAHMPEDAINLKSPPKDPSVEGHIEDKQAESEEDGPVGLVSSTTANGINGRSMQSPGSPSSDKEEDEQLLLMQTGFVLNDLAAEDRLIDDAMDLTSPVGGGEGDKDALDMEIDLLVRDDNVANQIALIDTQPEMSFDQCLEAMDTKSPSEQSDQCLEPLSPKRVPSPMDQQLTHTSEFFEELSSRPSVNVNADKSDIQWPFMDEDEVLDYEADYDVLTLVVDSDELEDECLTKSKEETKPTEKPESRNQANMPKIEEELPKPELQPKPIDKPGIPNAENLRNFRIPKLNPELLKAQPSVMHSLYLQEDEDKNREKIKPVTPNLTEDVRKRREEAKAARRPKEAMPRFAPPFRPTHEVPVANNLSQPLFGPQDLAPPLFGPDDLAPIFVPRSNREEVNYRHPHVASQYAPETFISNSDPLSNRNFLPAMTPQLHPSGASQYVPQNLATSERNILRPAEVPSASQQGIGAKHWIMEIFGAKCLSYLDNKCLAVNCDHTMSPVGEVERRLLSMPEEALVNTYRQALRSFHLFELYFKCFANIFERRKLGQHLLQMLANSRLYRSMTVSIVGYVFLALKRSGLEREATSCIMTDLWVPDKAHKFNELTLALLKILETANWQDYIDKLVELHEKYKFLLSDEFMIRIMEWADVTKNEPLQKKAMMMLLADMTTYSRSPTLMSLIGRFSNLDPDPNVPQLGTGLASPAQQQQQQQYVASNWNPHANPNQTPSLIPQIPAIGLPPQYQASNWNHNPNQVPGAVPGSSLIRSNPALTPLWNHSQIPSHPYRDLPGAGPIPSLIQTSPLAGQHQAQQDYLASNWRSQ